MTKKFPVNPAHPERICWGCDRYCPVDAMACGNGSIATSHPAELFGEDWLSWGLDAPAAMPRPAGGEPSTDTDADTPAGSD